MSKISKEILGTISSNEEVVLYTIENAGGSVVKLINIGAAIHSIIVPNKAGEMVDVALGFEDYTKYMNDGAALGKSVGRYANRIAKGHFTLDGVEYSLAINNGVNALHGGPTGLWNRVCDSCIKDDSVVFSYVSPDGEEGYPSELAMEVTYTFTDCNELQMVYSAVTDGATVVNLTNHNYFNLNGESAGDIHTHTLKVNADTFLPTDDTQVPIGEFAPVAGTPMDFTEAKAIGQDIEADYEPLIIGHGYDHCWVLNNYKKGVMQTAAELYSEQSGICLTVFTTQPAAQVYTGNWLTGAGVSKSGRDITNRDGVAIECQNFPDAPNKPSFPCSVLRKGEKYEEKISFKFSVK